MHDLENTQFADPESIARCVKLVDSFGDEAIQLGYVLWEGVDFHGRIDIVQELSQSKKAALVASDVDSSSISELLQSPGKLAMQRRRLAQTPRINLAKTNQAATAEAFAS